MIGKVVFGDVAVDANHVQRPAVPIALGDSALAAYPDEFAVGLSHAVCDFVCGRSQSFQEQLHTGNDDFRHHSRTEDRKQPDPDGGSFCSLWMIAANAAPELESAVDINAAYNKSCGLAIKGRLRNQRRSIDK